MNSKDNILIWKYIDGLCTAEEKQAVEARLAKDPAFKQAYAERLKLQEALSHTETEQPSMRFAVAVFEQLPDLYNRFTFRPLIQPFWAKAFVGALGSFIAGLITYLLVNADAAAQPSGPAAQTAQMVSGLFQSIPNNLFILTAASSAGFILLFFLDRKLKQSFKEKPGH